MKENALYKMAILIVSLLTSSVDTFATEAPFHLRSSTVSIATTSTGGAVKVRLTVKLPTPCHQAASWGLVPDDGPTFSANSQFLVDPQAACVQVVTSVEHEYDLGLLPPGSYKFVGKPVSASRQ